MGVSCIHLAAAFASLMFILFLSYGETTGGGVPSDAVTAHQEGYGAKEPEGGSAAFSPFYCDKNPACSGPIARSPYESNKE